MTVPAQKRPDEQEIEQARLALRLLSDFRHGPSTQIRVDEGEGGGPITALVPAAAFDMFLEVLRYIGEGQAISLLSHEERLSTQQAADILNVSRPFLIRLLEKNVMPHEKVGRHRRVRAADVLAYKARRLKESRQSLAELAQLSQELDLP